MGNQKRNKKDKEEQRRLALNEEMAEKTKQEDLWVCLNRRVNVDIVCMICGARLSVKEEVSWDKLACKGCGRLGLWRFE